MESGPPSSARGRILQPEVTTSPWPTALDLTTADGVAQRPRLRTA
jgi:hypothetical protein